MYGLPILIIVLSILAIIFAVGYANWLHVENMKKEWDKNNLGQFTSPNKTNPQDTIKLNVGDTIRLSRLEDGSLILKRID